MVLVDRVIQLKSRSGESWESASGFLLNEGAVITAAHAVIGADPVSSIEARLFRSNSWCKAFVAWSDKELDIALLQLVEPANPVTGAMPRWGQVKGTLAPVEAIGFPGFAVRDELRDTEHLLGQLRLLSGARQKLLQVDVVGQRIEANNWTGMSGAALFCKGYLIGIVTEAIRDTGRLVAQPLWSLLEREDFRAALRSTVVPETIIGMSGVQPSLERKLLLRSPRSRLTYSARATPLLGRDPEIDRLRGFLEDTRPFLWWLVTGGSGSGKSRLALEFTLRHWGDWWTGFLAGEQDAGFWSNWKPEWPTLMVVDYVAARAGTVGKLVDVLQERALELEFPVRVLLIARSADEPWWKEFLGRGSRTARESILSAQFDLPLQLAGLSTEDNWALIEHTLNEGGVSWSATERSYLMKTLQRIDPGGSPIYAVLLAESFANSKEEAFWDFKAVQWNAAWLLDNVIERERAQWQAFGMTTNDEHTLALATMLGGLDLEILEDNRAQGLLTHSAEYSPDRIKAIGGKASDVEVPPLEPSLIAEAFVLALPTSKIDKTLRDLNRLAFELDPMAASQFLLHACMDFPEHPNLEHLLPSHPGTVLGHYTHLPDKTKESTRFIAGALAIAYAVRGSKASTAQAAQVGQVVMDWLKTAPDDAELQETAAYVLRNLIACASAQGATDFAVKTLNELGNLWARTRASVCATALASSLFNLGTVALHLPIAGLTADQAIDMLERLSKDAPYPEITIDRARLLVNASIDACEKSQIDGAAFRCGQLLEIQTEGPLSSELWRLQTKCLRNVCLAQALDNRFEEAKKTYTSVVAIAGRDTSLLRWQVLALADLIRSASAALELEEAWEFYQHLARLPRASDVDSQAQIAVCIALGNFALKLCKILDCERAEQVHFAWRGRIAEAIPQCRAVWAQVGANLVSAYNQKRDFVSAERIFSDNRRLLAIDPTNREIAGDLGRSAQVLVAYLAGAGKIMEARTLLAEHERDLYALAKDDRASLYAATVFAFLLVLTNTNVAAEQVKDLLQSHGAELVSPQFHESVRAQMGEDVAAEWSRRINALLSGLA